MIPPEWRDDFAQSDFAEWKKWLSYDAVERPRPEELEGLEKNDVLTFRMIRTDKNEATRGKKSYQEHPLKAKSRGVLPGYRDRQLINGLLNTDAPTLTAEATATILQMTAVESDWRLEQGDVDSAFLNGRYLDADRRVYFRAPKGGFPAVPELGWDYIPEGTILKAKKGVNGSTMRRCCGIWNTVTRFFHWKGQRNRNYVPLSFCFAIRSRRN